jgi:hypothetical protein
MNGDVDVVEIGLTEYRVMVPNFDPISRTHRHP